MTWHAFKVIFYNNFVPQDERNKAPNTWFLMFQRSSFVNQYMDRYREVLLKVLDPILDFLQLHKSVLELKETILSLISKKKWTTSNEEVDLALVLDDGKNLPK